MRIYTEVNFEWDEKQGKLIEVSSDSYDYEGELSFAAQNWKYLSTIWYDENGYRYRLRYKKALLQNKTATADIERSKDGESWTKVKNQLMGGKNTTFPTIKREFKKYVEGNSLNTKTAYGVEGRDDKSVWEAYWEEVTGNTNFDEDPADNRQTLLDLGETDLDDTDLSDAEITAKTQADILIKDSIKEWNEIIDIGGLDTFEENIKEYVGDLKDLEQNVRDSYTDIFGAEGELSILQEDFETSTKRSQDDFRTGMRDAREDLSEGLEGTITTREQSLEEVREGAKANIRSAEAKIAASGFASTGVGKSARDLLAEEIGKDARSVDEAFTEDRSDIKKTYITDTEELQKTIGQEGTAYDDYKKLRERSANTALKDWKTQSDLYKSKLEDFTGFKEIQTEFAQRRLGEIAGDISGEIFSAQEIYEDYNPFAEAGVLADFTPDEFALDPFLGGYMYDPSMLKSDLFTEDSYVGYTPEDDLKLYDPNVKMPWETSGAKNEEIEDEGKLPFQRK